MFFFMEIEDLILSFNVMYATYFEKIIFPPNFARQLTYHDAMSYMIIPLRNMTPNYPINLLWQSAVFEIS
jgi:hypothetical protein